MSYNPVKVLYDEHEVIKQAEQVIQKIDKTWELNPEAYSETVGKLIRFFREYSDEFHHKKEEDILFKELLDNPDFLLKDIIGELNGHHEMFRETVGEVEEAIAENAYEKAQKLLLTFIDELLDHIAVEDDELFIMAENLYDAEELKRIFFLFEDK